MPTSTEAYHSWLEKEYPIPKADSIKILTSRKLFLNVADFLDIKKLQDMKSEAQNQLDRTSTWGSSINQRMSAKKKRFAKSIVSTIIEDIKAESNKINNNWSY